MKDASILPCCGASACDDCLRSELVGNARVCPICHRTGVSPEALQPNERIRRQVVEYLEQSRAEGTRSDKTEDSLSDDNDEEEEVEVASDAVLLIGVEAEKRDQHVESDDLVASGKRPRTPQHQPSAKRACPSEGHKASMPHGLGSNSDAEHAIASRLVVAEEGAKNQSAASFRSSGFQHLAPHNRGRDAASPRRPRERSRSRDRRRGPMLVPTAVSRSANGWQRYAQYAAANY